MVNVLFVCTGNICRSPIAEATFIAEVQKYGLQNYISCDSAATHNYHIGSLPDKRTRKNALTHGITLTHKCRQLQADDFSDFDYIIAMDHYNMENIQTLYYKSTGKSQLPANVFMYRQVSEVFDPSTKTDKPALEVPDPYYGDEDDFENVYQIVLSCAQKLVKYLAAQLANKGYFKTDKNNTFEQ